MYRSIAAAAAVAALATAPAGAGAATTDGVFTTADVHQGAWSYFGDPRALAHGSSVFTGLVTGTGSIVVQRNDMRTGRSFHAHLHRQAEVDDHDNPSLAFWRRHLYAFYAPHSGRIYPLNRRSEMHYRVSRRAYDIRGGFGPERHVRTNTPGGLGFTYPNPVPTRGKLWLFWRGGNWQPTFSYTRDGVHWARARTLVEGPSGQRPYAKYTGGPDGSIHMIFSEGHARSYPTSLYYLRYRAGRFYSAGGRRIASMRDLPLHVEQLDRVYRYTPAGGRAWPHDVAVADGRPVAVYTRRINGSDTFYYAAWDGTRWVDRRIVAAGHGAHTFTSGGITLDHGDPSRVVLSRRVDDRWFLVELWSTSDGGATWRTTPITAGSDIHDIRPVIPRGACTDAELVVLYVHGKAADYTTFRTIRTTIRMTVARARWA